MNVQTGFATLTWSTSRGRDTYGYNICRLDGPLAAAPFTRRYRTCGGGYDMTGTVLGEWLADRFQDRLLAITERAGAVYTKANGYQSFHDDGTGRAGRTIKPDCLYGMTYYPDDRRVSLDGACGKSCMESIAAAIGVSLTSVCNRKGHVTGYMMTDYGSAQALRDARA